MFRASGGYAALRDLLHYCPLAEATSLEPSQLERDFYTEHQVMREASGAASLLV